MGKHRLVATMPEALRQKLLVIGSDLSAARRVRSMTQDQFAERICVSRKVVWRMEKGDPTVSFGTYAMAAWLMGLDKNLVKMFSPETDAVFQRAALLALPRRIRSHTSNEDDLDF